MKQSVRDHAKAFNRLVVLGAEVSWKGGNPLVSTVEIDYPLLKQVGCPVGLALRIGPYSGPFAGAGEPAKTIADVAAGLVSNARAHGIEPAELQIDFDCPESKLDGYSVWLGAIRQAIGSTPLTITALPSWLDRSSFRRLVTQVPQYVLQVHSLTRPSSPDHMPPLCDIPAARDATLKAARIGRPFLVALPTYGYHVAFDNKGKYLGISAEGPLPHWPGGATVRVLEADANQLSQLVATWMHERPSAMAGVIWYRLPSADDRLNWPWPTLVQVITGAQPRASLHVELTRSQPLLVDVAIVNSGSAALVGGVSVTVTCRDGKFLASDALAGFECELADGKAEFRGRAGQGMLPPGGKLAIGWVRLSQDAEARVHVETIGD